VTIDARLPGVVFPFIDGDRARLAQPAGQPINKAPAALFALVHVFPQVKFIFIHHVKLQRIGDGKLRPFPFLQVLQRRCQPAGFRFNPRALGSGIAAPLPARGLWVLRMPWFIPLGHLMLQT
jgi:hypothetical protein